MCVCISLSHSIKSRCFCLLQVVQNWLGGHVKSQRFAAAQNRPLVSKQKFAKISNENGSAADRSICQSISSCSLTSRRICICLHKMRKTKQFNSRTVCKSASFTNAGTERKPPCRRSVSVSSVLLIGGTNRCTSSKFRHLSLSKLDRTLSVTAQNVKKSKTDHYQLLRQIATRPTFATCAMER